MLLQGGSKVRGPPTRAWKILGKRLSGLVFGGRRVPIISRGSMNIYEQAMVYFRRYSMVVRNAIKDCCWKRSLFFLVQSIE